MKQSFHANLPIVEMDSLIRAIWNIVTTVAHRASLCLQHQHSSASHHKVNLSPAEHQHLLNTAEIEEEVRETKTEETG